MEYKRIKLAVFGIFILAVGIGAVVSLTAVDDRAKAEHCPEGYACIPEHDWEWKVPEKEPAKPEKEFVRPDKQTTERNLDAVAPGQWYGGVITKNIDGNTIEIEYERIRLPMVDVKDSGNPNMPHSELARNMCPVGTYAWYNIDDNQGKDKYGRIVATVFCYEGGHLDTAMVHSGLGWFNSYWCSKSEFQYAPYVLKLGGC